MPAAAERQDLESLRVQMHRKLAAQLDVSDPEPPRPPPAPPEAERLFVVPKADAKGSRQRMDNLRAEAQRNSITRLEKRGLSSFLPTGRRRTNPARILLVIVALVAGGLAAFLAIQHEPTAAAPAPVAAPAEAAKPLTTKILVAKGAVEVGQSLSSSMVEWADWPQAQLRPDYLTLAQAPNSAADLNGWMARYALFPGEPIEKVQLAPPGSSYLSAILGKGMRAVSVSVAADSASGGFVAPDDHVDVVLTRSSDGGHDAQTILSDVRVLAINAQLGSQAPPAGSGDAKPNVFTGQAIATLELDPTQGNVITEAALVGKLSLVLRPTGDAVSADVARERAVNAAIRLTSPFWASGGAPTAPAPPVPH